MFSFSRLAKWLQDTFVPHQLHHHFLFEHRHLRILTGFLIISIVLLVLFFPVLFLYVESGSTVMEFEEAAMESPIVQSFASAFYQVRDAST